MTRSKKRNRKSKKSRSKRPAGDSLTRSFAYPSGDGILVKGIPYGGGGSVSVTEIRHSLVNAGASDASMFLKYYQWFRIHRVYLTFKCISESLIPTYQSTAVSTALLEPIGTAQILLIPWRDGVPLPTFIGTQTYVDKLVGKYRQQRGVKYFQKPIDQLKKGFTVSYKPNTLNVSFETTGGITGATYHAYSPNYDVWVSNNDNATEFYGYQVVVLQNGQAPIQLRIKQVITMQFKGKCNDPLITVVPNSADNSNRSMNMLTASVAANAGGHDLVHTSIDTSEYCCRATGGVMENEQETTPETIDIGAGNDPTANHDD